MVKNKIKGIHVTLDADDLEKLRVLMMYYGFDSVTNMLRKLIYDALTKVIEEEKKKTDIRRKIEKILGVDLQ
jgi:hypothetical protein